MQMFGFPRFCSTFSQRCHRFLFSCLVLHCAHTLQKFAICHQQPPFHHGRDPHKPILTAFSTILSIIVICIICDTMTFVSTITALITLRSLLAFPLCFGHCKQITHLVAKEVFWASSRCYRIRLYLTDQFQKHRHHYGKNREQFINTNLSSAIRRCKPV